MIKMERERYNIEKDKQESKKMGRERGGEK